MTSFRKKITLAKVAAKFFTGQDFPIWTHFWVTDRCNLKCSYCYFHNNKSSDPKLEVLLKRIEHAKSLGTSIISLMGGEPTLRDDLDEIIKHTTQQNLGSILSTNGYASFEKFQSYAEAGLDLIQVSIDGYDDITESKKTIANNPELLPFLSEFRKEYELGVFINHVLTPQTISQTIDLIEYSKKLSIPISIGVVTNPNSEDDYTQFDIKTIDELFNQISDKQNEGYPIITPQDYFRVARDRIVGNNVPIECNVGRYVIQVATSGKIYKCSKLELESDLDFFYIENNYFKDRTLDCRYRCLSNCAHTTNYFTDNPKRFFKHWSLTKKNSDIP